MFEKRDRWWWFGVPIVTGLISWLPYWGWNIAAGVSHWWRVFVVTPGLFDTYVYLHWMGAAAHWLPYGGHLKWFGMFIGVLWSVIGRVASIPELWIISRWITFTLVIWVAAWTFERWANLTRLQARTLSVAFFAAVVLTLGMRPGVYAWYLPFCLAGMTCALFTVRALTRKSLFIALRWSVAALILTWLYPWFFMVVGLWLAVVWLIAAARFRWWLVPALLALFAGLTIVAGIPAAQWFLNPAQAGLIGMYERNGMVFARVPFLANTVLAMGAWILFLFGLAYRAHRREEKGRFILLGAGWITMLLLWFHTPFTGLHTYSDHLIGPITALAWISLAVIWGAVREPNASEHVTEKILQRIIRFIPLLMAACATIFFLYVLQQPVRFNLFKFDSYVIHLAHWFALAAAGWLAAWRIAYPSAPVPQQRVLLALIVPSLLIGFGGLTPLFIRDLSHVAEIQDRTPVVAWIRNETTPEDRLCADPESAAFYAAHTGRRVFPAEATLSWPEPSEQIIQDLIAFVSAYDVRGAGEEEVFRFFTDHYRTIPCVDESQYSHNAPYARVLSAWGFSEEDVDRLIGCDKETLKKNRTRMDDAIDLHATDLVNFPNLCPSVIIPSAQKTFWHLPKDYIEHPITSDVSVWQKP